MKPMELILTRKSVRTFDGRELSAEGREKLQAYMTNIRNPYGIPVKYVWLDATEYGLSSPVIQGEHLYIAGKVRKGEHCEEAFGYFFEQLVLYAWLLGIGITWIGGTMNRELFEKAAKVQANELMPIVTPVGYPSGEKSEVDVKLRNHVHGMSVFLLRSFSLKGIFPHGSGTGRIAWRRCAGHRQQPICSLAAL